MNIYICIYMYTYVYIYIYIYIYVLMSNRPTETCQDRVASGCRVVA